MEILHCSKSFLFFIFYLSISQAVVKAASENDERKTYIVFMGDLPAGVEVKTELVKDHHNLLLNAIGDEGIAGESLLYSYGKSFNGFAAKLLPHEADQLSGSDKVVSIFRDTICHPLTTRSWDFLDMPINVPRNQNVESDIVIGFLDTGIYVSSQSFNDTGFGPPPKKWRGLCEKGGDFPGCNNKVIGARYFDAKKSAPQGQRSPADYDGHGTHVSSTAAGVPVENANVRGVFKGTARGGVPLARIAMYRVCSGGSCSGADILAAFDAAIHDGVDILSVSLGGEYSDYIHSPIAIGSLYAVKKGILVVAAAGNDGFTHPIRNSAPWIMTVAATMIDRVLESPFDDANLGSISDVTTRSRAPMSASFSSRGPDYISKRILKPDIAAPGQTILAAYSKLAAYPEDFNILSGTSMATPHVASAAAYLKSFHPDWSPAVLRSALMTTAKPMRWNEQGHELATGAGNIDPITALDPGLVYDIDPNSYDMYNCQLNATNTSSTCPNIPDQMGHDGLNYPSFHYQLNSPNETNFNVTFHRTVTYVGKGETKYTSVVDSPEGLFIKVEPAYFLIDDNITKQNSFTVTLQGQFKDKEQWYLLGSIAWLSNAHLVKSPVLVYRGPSRIN